MLAARRFGTTALALLGFAAIWELYKYVGGALGLEWPISTDDLTMPHSWDIVTVLFEPVQRGGDLTVSRFRPADSSILLVLMTSVASLVRWGTRRSPVRTSL